MSRIFVNIGLSLDGYMASEGMTLRNWDNPGYKDWGARWAALMSWKSPWRRYCSVVGNVCSRTCVNPGRSFASTRFLMVQALHICAMCTRDDGLITGCTGRCPQPGDHYACCNMP